MPCCSESFRGGAIRVCGPGLHLFFCGAAGAPESISPSGATDRISSAERPQLELRERSRNDERLKDEQGEKEPREHCMVSTYAGPKAMGEIQDAADCPTPVHFVAMVLRARHRLLDHRRNARDLQSESLVVAIWSSCCWIERALRSTTKSSTATALSRILMARLI